METLHKIRRQGFELNLLGDSFEIVPASKLSQSQRDFLKTHKTEIIAELKASQAVNDVLRMVTCYTPSGIPIEVEAIDARHEAFLKQMNPQRTGLKP